MNSKPAFELKQAANALAVFLPVLLALYFSGCASARPVFRHPDATGSIGFSNDGALAGGRQLTSFPGARVINPDRCWGTPEAVSLLIEAVVETQKAFPDSPDVVIGDFSTEHGGRLSPHISHQSGRDVDVSLYLLTPPRCERCFTTATAENLDADRTWYFIETLLLTDRVEMILVDYEVQTLLYDYVKLGYSEERLETWFQYPRGRSTRQGVIRHAAGHHDHLHIRFKCPETDIDCGR